MPLAIVGKCLDSWPKCSYTHALLGSRRERERERAATCLNTWRGRFLSQRDIGVTRPSRNRIVADWHVCVIYVPSAHKIRQVRRQTETPVGETASVCTVTGESTTCVTHRRRIFTHVFSSSETDRWGIARNHRRDTQVRSGCRTWTFQQQTASVLTITMLRYFRCHCSSVNFKQDVRKIQRNVTQAKTKPITWVCLV